MPSYKLSDYERIAQEYASRVGIATSTSLHMAFIYSRSGICIGMATNSVGSRSRGAGYSKHTIHAERAVLRAVGDVSLLRDASLVVVRISKFGKILGSAPCHECRCHLTAAMRKYGLRRVYYSSPSLSSLPSLPSLSYSGSSCTHRPQEVSR